MGGLGIGGPDMGGLILYGACNGGPWIVRNVPNPAPTKAAIILIIARAFPWERLDQRNLDKMFLIHSRALSKIPGMPLCFKKLSSSDDGGFGAHVKIRGVFLGR